MYPPQNGAEVRLWETAQKLNTLGELWVAAPPGGTYPDEDINWIEITSPLFNTQPVWNELWTGLFLFAKQHPLRRLLTDAVVEPVNKHDVSFDLVVCEFPQMADAARSLTTAHDAALLLNKHNADHAIVDGVLKGWTLPRIVRRRIVANVREFEASNIAAADAAVFQSPTDREVFDAEPRGESYVIPNGCDFQWISEGGDPDRAAQECGLSREGFTCIFLGSYDYEPNRRAATRINDWIAPEFPDVRFLLAGRNPPSVTAENVYTPGYVDELAGTLQLADVALCPLHSGSGTKLKMLDYFAAGLPVVSTPTGTQGLDVEDDTDVLLYDDAEGIVEGIKRLQSSDELRKELSVNCQTIAEQYSWDTLMSEYESVVNSLAES